MRDKKSAGVWLARVGASVPLVAGVAVFGIDMASGQTYPTKPIRIVASETGGSVDTLARLIAQGISGSLGQAVIVENRPGGVIPGEVVAKALPDGYTLLVLANTFWIGPLLYRVPYDVERDFAPITLALSAPNIVVVNLSSPVKSIKELIALAKARPGELNYASGAAGTPNRIAAELFKSMAGVNIVRIPYKGAAPALSALMGNEVQLMITSAGPVVPHLNSGRLRALAVTSAQPSTLFPGLATVSASGLPGYESGAFFAIFAPAKTPSSIIDRLNQEIIRTLTLGEVKEKLLNSGIEVVASTPSQLAAVMKSEMTVLGKLIKDRGIHTD